MSTRAGPAGGTDDQVAQKSNGGKSSWDGNQAQHDKSIKVVSAGSLIMLQIFSRFLTLFMTQLQLRLTSAEVLGAANIHFELLLGLILTLSREGFRTALSRSSGVRSQGGRSQSAISNVALLPVPMGISISVVAMQVYTRYLAPKQLVLHQHFTYATGTFLAGALLELLGEPLYIGAIMRVKTGTRVMAEGAAVAAKSFVTLAALWLIDDKSSLLPFGIGQTAYGAAFLTVFWVSHAREKGVKQALQYLGPRQGESASNPGVILNRFDAEALSLSATMTRQNLIKHGLGEGDKFAVARLASLSDQGAYALATNYGSLVARLLYQPLEESSRLTFAQVVGDNKQDAISAASWSLVTDLLTTLLSFHVILSLFLITFCSPFSTLALQLLAGRYWATQTSAPLILSIYGSTYLPAMAFNGLLEGFLQSSASPTQLTRYAFVLAGASVLFILSLVGFERSSDSIGAEAGLILASTISTVARAAYCFRYTVRYISQAQDMDAKHKRQTMPSLSLASILPHGMTLATFATSAVIIRWRPYSMASGTPLELPANHLIAGISCACLCAGTCAVYERQTLLGTLRAIRGRSPAK